MGGLLCRKCRPRRSQVAPRDGKDRREAWKNDEDGSEVSSTARVASKEEIELNGDKKSTHKVSNTSAGVANADQRRIFLSATKPLLPGQPLDTVSDPIGESSSSSSIESDHKGVKAEVTTTPRASDHATRSDQDIVASSPAKGDARPATPQGSRPVSREDTSRPSSVQTSENVTKRVSATAGASEPSGRESTSNVTVTGPEETGRNQNTVPSLAVTEVPLLPNKPVDKAPHSRCGSSTPNSTQLEGGHRTVETVTAQSEPNSDNHARPTVVMVQPWTGNLMPGEPLVKEPTSENTSSRPTSVHTLESERLSATSRASDHPSNETKKIPGSVLGGCDQSTTLSSPVTDAALLPGRTSTSSSSMVESSMLRDESFSSISLTPVPKGHNSTPQMEHLETNSNQEQRSILSSFMPKKSEKPTREKIATLLSSWDASGKLEELESSTENGPQNSTHSISDLAIALKGDDSYNLTPIESQIALCYKIYCWVAKNVMYKRGCRNTDPNDVLRTRQAVCHGYTTLFQALAEDVGLTVRRVSGNTRDWLCSPGTKFIPDTSNQHTWNIVKIENVWFPVDCTFGSGSTIHGRFVRKFNKLYFFPAPEQLILTHWVEDERLQLLEHPATLTDLQQLVVPTLETLSLGIVPTTETQFITLPPNNNVAEVCFSCKPNILFTASLTPILNSQGSNTVQLASNMTFVKQCRDNVVISAIVPTAGSFLLKVYFTRRTNLDGKSALCLSYIITSETQIEELDYVGFPRVYSHTAARCGFSVNSWKGSKNQPKHIMKANGTLKMNVELDSNAKIEHCVKRGKVSDQNSAWRNCLTRLSPNKTNPILHHLNVVFPSEGWWTLIASDMEQRKILMEYEIYCIRGIQNRVYPSTTRAANELGISLLDNNMQAIHRDSVSLAITFTAPPDLIYDAELNQIDENGKRIGRSAPNHCTYVSPKQADSLRMVYAIIPLGCWSLDLYAGEPSSTTLKCVMHCEPLSGSDTQLHLAYPIVHKRLLDMGLSLPEDMLPYTSTCNTGLFQFPFDAPHDVCYSLSLKQDNAITSECDGYAVVSKPEGSSSGRSRINVIIPRPGQWMLTVFAQRSNLLAAGSGLPSVFELHLKATACPLENKIFPRVTHEFMRMSLLPPYNIEEWLLPRTLMGVAYPKHIDISFIQLSEEVELFREVEHNKQEYTGDIARLKDDTRNGEIVRTLALVIPEEGEWVFTIKARYLQEKKPVVSEILSYTVSVIDA